MRNRVARMIGLGCLLAAAGCSTPEHSNTLIFATNTKIALDVSVNPAGGTPDITLGYKRQEGVFMPLLANQGPANARMPATCGPNADCTFKSEDHPTNGMTDTYSVLASLGAEFSSGASGDAESGASAQASGGLAQFFATGIAAQKLAAKGGAELVSIQPKTVDEAVVNALVEKIIGGRVDALQKVRTFVDDGSGSVDPAKRKALANCLSGQGQDVNENWLSEFDSKPVSDFTTHLSKEWSTLLVPIGECAK